MESQYEFKMITKKLEESVLIKDDDGNDLVIPLLYPKLGESHSFWNIVLYSLDIADDLKKSGVNTKNDLSKIENYDSIKSNLKSIEKILPNVCDYIFWSIETKQNKELSDEYKINLEHLISQNIDIVFEKVMDMFNKVLPKSDVAKKQMVKNLSQAKLKEQ